MQRRVTKTLSRAIVLFLIAGLLLPWVALASDVDTSVVDTTAPEGSVTLAPGESSNITIILTVTGNQVGTATFKVYRDWTLSDGVFTGSNPQEFTVEPRDPRDDPTVFSTTGTVSVASSQAAGTFTLVVGAFDITNSNETGAKLSPGKSSNYQVIVSASPSDTTAPVITPIITGTLGDNDWYVSDVTVSWSVVDNESAITSTSGCDQTTIDYDTPGETLTCTATSAGGTNSASVTIKRDATEPTITLVSRTPAPNANGWNNTDVTVTWSCADSTSGPVDTSVSQTVSSEGQDQSATGTCRDNAGNTKSDQQTGINIDKTEPSLDPTVSPNPVALNGSATASANATDNLSGIDTESCEAVDTSSVGTKSVNCTATDKAGNVATRSANYTVTYGLCVLYDQAKAHKSGSTIPIKLQLCDANGNNVSSSATLVKALGWKLVSRDTSGNVEDSGNANPDSNFRYDAKLGGTGGYIFNLSTKGLDTGTYALSFTAGDDPTIHTVEFQVK